MPVYSLVVHISCLDCALTSAPGVEYRGLCVSPFEGHVIIWCTFESRSFSLRIRNHSKLQRILVTAVVCSSKTLAFSWLSSNLSKSKSLFSLKKKTPTGRFFFRRGYRNIWFSLFFSLQGLRKGSRPPTDPKMPFPFWKNDYFVTHMSSRYTIHLQIKKNQLKSGRDG